MSTNQIESGDNITLAAPSGGVVSGTPYLIGTLFGVALQSAAQGENFILQTEGVFSITKLTSDDVAAGAVLYWDNSNKRLSTTSTSNYKVGAATSAAGTSATKVNCRLNGITVAAEAGA